MLRVATAMRAGVTQELHSEADAERGQQHQSPSNMPQTGNRAKGNRHVRNVASPRAGRLAVPG